MLTTFDHNVVAIYLVSSHDATIRFGSLFAHPFQIPLSPHVIHMSKNKRAPIMWQHHVVVVTFTHCRSSVAYSQMSFLILVICLLWLWRSLPLPSTIVSAWQDIWLEILQAALRSSKSLLNKLHSWSRPTVTIAARNWYYRMTDEWRQLDLAVQFSSPSRSGLLFHRSHWFNIHPDSGYIGLKCGRAACV